MADWGPWLGSDPHAVLRHVLRHEVDTTGLALEFGVATGGTLRMIAAHMRAVGFDSFDGLPELWRAGFPAGMFACEPPDVPGAQIVVGRFADTLPGWVLANPDATVTLVHIDCDLYESTRTVLAHAPIRPGCVVVLDEHHGYPGWEAHEARAWAETDIAHTVIGHGPEQLAVRVEETLW